MNDTNILFLQFVNADKLQADATLHMNDVNFWSEQQTLQNTATNFMSKTLSPLLTHAGDRIITKTRELSSQEIIAELSIEQINRRVLHKQWVSTPYPPNHSISSHWEFWEFFHSQPRIRTSIIDIEAQFTGFMENLSY